MTAALKKFAYDLTHATHNEQLFAMSDAQLATRGLNRDGLVRAYVSGLGLS